jgi:hypothetical protein
VCSSLLMIYYTNTSTLHLHFTALHMHAPVLSIYIHTQLLDPRVGDFNVRTFLSLVQADGYNPLNVATSQFLIRDQDDVAKIVVAATGYDSADLTGLLKRPFRPGDLFQNIEKKVIFNIQK